MPKLRDVRGQAIRAAIVAAVLVGCAVEPAESSRDLTSADAGADAGADAAADARPDALTDASCGCDADGPPGYDADNAEDMTGAEAPPAQVQSVDFAADAPLCVGNRVNPNGPCLGMCGARCNGTYCTRRCLDHDCCVRSRICGGMSAWKAHCLCLLQFFPAAGSLAYCALHPNDPGCQCQNGAFPNATCQ